MSSAMGHERDGETDLELTPEQKENLDKIMKEAQLFLESEEVQNRCRAVIAENESLDKAAVAELLMTTAGGYLVNSTIGPLTVMDMKIWEGYVSTDFPNPLPAGNNGNFSMAVMSDIGSVMAAVVYSGKNRAGAQCAWILGFLIPNNGIARAYVVCGPIERFIDPDWEAIQKKIKRAGSSGSYYDAGTGTQIYASIYAYAPGYYSVGAYFYG